MAAGEPTSQQPPAPDGAARPPLDYAPASARLSKKFERKIADQCNRFLDTLEERLRDGGPSSPGLWSALIQTVNLTAQAQRQAIRDALTSTSSVESRQEK